MGYIFATEEFKRFIEGVQLYGMPVNFLRVVGGNYYLVFNETYNQACRGPNTLLLQRSLLRHPISPEPPYGEASKILTVYHEATHAYFDIMAKDPAVSALVRKGEKYYRGAPFLDVKGTAVEQPERVTQEAAGMYVGARAGTWWTAFERLVQLGTAALGSDTAAAALESELVKIQSEYDKALAEPNYGYEQRGIQQLNVNKPIFPELKQYLDKELLENKIPDLFDQVRFFQDLMQQIRHFLGVTGFVATWR